VTVTRALNTGTRVNSSGLIETVNANLPRFDYNPTTKVCRGLLIEETRVQTARGSDQISAWSRSATTASANVVASPSGAQDADLIYPSSSGNNRQVYTQSSTAPTSGSVAISVFAADAGLNWLVIYSLNSTTPVAWFDVANGVKGTVVAGWTSEIEPYENGFYRCTVVGTAIAGGYITFGIANADNSVAVTASGTNGLYFWGAQCEAGAFKTSYISNPDVTNGSSVTRNADAVDMTSTNFSSWYNAGEGTLFAEASTFSNASTDKFVANINNNGFPNRILINFSATNNFAAAVVSNSVSQVSGTNGTATTLNTPIKMCFATKLDNFAFSQSGVAPTTDNLGAMPVTVDRLWIGGANTSSFLNGHMRQVKFWPQRLTNAEVQAFSK
jgi:hypothetical protein